MSCPCGQVFNGQLTPCIHKGIPAPYTGTNSVNGLTHQSSMTPRVITVHLVRWIEGNVVPCPTCTPPCGTMWGPLLHVGLLANTTKSREKGVQYPLDSD